MEESLKLRSMKHMVRHLSPVLADERESCSWPIIAGWTYCGLGALKLLGADAKNDCASSDSDATEAKGEEFWKDVIHWLVSRQTTFIEEFEDDTSIESDPLDGKKTDFRKEGAHLMNAPETDKVELLSIEPSTLTLAHAGFNGRCNKIADTCYAFWVGGSLAVKGIPSFRVNSC